MRGNRRTMVPVEPPGFPRRLGAARKPDPAGRIRPGVDARQRGMALFVCLALLLVLGIAGSSAVRTTILEERMARNAGDALLAFQAAEAALREGEELLAGGVAGIEFFTDEGNDGLWTPARPGEAERWTIPGIWDPGSSRSRSVRNHLDLVAEQPRFIVERIATLRSTANAHLIEESGIEVEERVEIFRVTARGVGRTANARALVQSTFGVLI